MEWATPAAFLPGGTIDVMTTGFRQQYGPRVVEVWRRDIAKYAGNVPVTTSIIERHARQSLAHWALHRAACFAANEPVKAKAGMAGIQQQTPQDKLRRKLGWKKR